ncbi:hypothetical protein PF005_g1814 [Phytophthora fragariae]|uniref:DUF7769 domain-containing protein n=1 Tax=Phytophthora fragariae TaxID=53985 RepID=A0A6A3FT76_9STRA|nr:hypothetical protein PF003_g32355 [Phytophthora fragariae]KAE8948492.1 hypothetical protein PF009_g1942 [Phytophthora fragariae]KAE9029367.1 hypothetical protein PF011_g1112 [Phytophthora fragariae]KAE9137004.1 hypothetical protein PF007_g1977 [Phytophthora fragariae]KAE9234636.1 hypothetical protein PF005_g1814 [Phytophthora fragariae]
MGVKQATNDERRVLWETLLFRSKNGKLKRGDIKQAAANFGLGRSVVSRLWERGVRSMRDRVAAVVEARWNLRGRNKKDRAALCQKIRDIPKADRRNYRFAKAATTISDHLMRQLLKDGYLHRALTQTRPLLTETHKIERLKWCVGYVKQNWDGECSFDAMYDTVHVDELTTLLNGPSNQPLMKKIYLIRGCGRQKRLRSAFKYSFLRPFR